MELSVQVVENSIDVFRGGPAMIKEHQARTAKAMKMGKSIISQWEAAYAETDEEKKMVLLSDVDTRSNSFLSKCSTAKAEMNENRKAITSLMDAVKTMFTEEENRLDVKKGGPPAQIQTLRNAYAKWVEDERKRVEAAAKIAADKKQEEADIKAHFKTEIARQLLLLLSGYKEKAISFFNNLTLENFQEGDERLRKMKVEFPKEKTSGFRPVYNLCKHHSGELDTILSSVINAYDYASFQQEYEGEMTTFKHDLIDKLPSKFFELTNAENKRLKDVEDERIRQEAIAAEKNKGAKEKLKAEADKARVDAENERIRIENEKANREKEETAKLEEDNRLKLKQAEEAIELQKTAEHAEAMFDQVAETAALGQTHASKKGFLITVKHHAGWVELFQFWYQRVGVKLSLEEFDKKTFKQIKAFAEKCAKEGQMIESLYLVYEEDVRAINKKELV